MREVRDRSCIASHAGLPLEPWQWPWLESLRDWASLARQPWHRRFQPEVLTLDTEKLRVSTVAIGQKEDAATFIRAVSCFDRAVRVISLITATFRAMIPRHADALCADVNESILTCNHKPQCSTRVGYAQFKFPALPVSPAVTMLLPWPGAGPGSRGDGGMSPSLLHWQCESSRFAVYFWRWLRIVSSSCCSAT